MIEWTVIFKINANLNTLGEAPYMVRAHDRDEAVAKARDVHTARHGKQYRIRQVLDVVQWATAS